MEIFKDWLNKALKQPGGTQSSFWMLVEVGDLQRTLPIQTFLWFCAGYLSNS